MARPVRGMNLFHNGEIVPTRPIAGLVRALDGIDGDAKLKILVIGSGHAGIELALAIHARLPLSSVTVVGRGTKRTEKGKLTGERENNDNEKALRSERNTKALDAAAVRMRRFGIKYMENFTVTELRPPGIALLSQSVTVEANVNEHDKRAACQETSNGIAVEFDTAVLATGANPPALLSQTDLPLTDDGWMGCGQYIEEYTPERKSLRGWGLYFNIFLLFYQRWHNSITKGWCVCRKGGAHSFS